MKNRFISTPELMYRYYCEISRPENLQPIPQAKCKIFFDIKRDQTNDKYTINFHFESDSLIHSWDDMTLRSDAFEVYSFDEYEDLDGEDDRDETKSEVRIILGN